MSREDVDGLVKQHRDVIYFGHGEVDALVVPRRLWRGRRVLIDASNLRGVPGRVVVAVACWSGEGLARAATSPGVTEPVASYIGWRDEVSWPPEWSEPIGDAVIEGVSELLNGATIDTCSEAMADAFRRAHDRYRNDGPQRLGRDRSVFGKMCATYWQQRIAVEGDRGASLTL